MKQLLILLICAVFFFPFTQKAFAFTNPTTLPNNKVGVHILFPSEVSKAAELVNSNGGDWGYVIIPIQSGDKNLQKWQDFMDSCRKYHLIPIIRLATEGDYFNTTAWRKPTFSDVLDFANFLNSLTWPTDNRYIVVYNEVNRGDEWGGSPNPSEYAQIVSYAVTAFKSRSTDFFILSAGMDNAAANTSIAMNEYDFLTAMNQAVPGIFNQVDGIASHSYPNPAFAQPPSTNTKMSIDSFVYESNLVNSLASKQLPVFITETGWSNEAVPEDTIASYYVSAFTSVWNNPEVIAVTPFLLQAGGKPFDQFSLLDANGGATSVFKAIQSIQKTKGAPVVHEAVLAAQTQLLAAVPTQHFSVEIPLNSMKAGFKNIFQWILQLH